MTYSNNFVAVIKAGGKILREVEPGLVLLPFQTEYSVYLKNLNSKRALVSISIDGESIGNDIIMEANSISEIERFLESNMTNGHRFKFIQKTQEIINHRGDRIDDGMIRIEVRYEKDKPIIKETHEHHHHHHWDDHPWYYPKYYPPYVWYGSAGISTHGNSSGLSDGDSFCSTGDLSNVTFTNTIGTSTIGKANFVGHVESVNCFNFATPNTDEGITTKGSISSQQFHYGYIGELEENSIVITLRLRGCAGDVSVQKPITVKTKLICPMCGRHNKSTNSYCVNCGTHLL